MSKSRIMHRNSPDSPPWASSASGVYVVDSEGRAYLDACGGAAVCCLGYGNARVTAAIEEQVAKLAYMHSGFFTTEITERFAEDLIRHAPGNGLFDRVYFVSGGSEATETAVKLARQYHVARGNPERSVVISRRQSYHGSTLGALSVSGNPRRRRDFEPLLHRGELIAACNPYRDRRENESEEEYGLRAANALESRILELGEDRVMAFIAETVGGATLGAMPAVRGYFRRIREICDRYGVLLILDEVMCGMGRTGHLHACEWEGITADLHTIAKGIAGGYAPLGAVLISRRVSDVLSESPLAFVHGHTYIGHALACAAGMAVQLEIRERNLLENVRNLGEKLCLRLREVLGEHEFVGDIRGRGLFLGIELVADRETREPFDPGLELHKKLKHRAMEAGLMCYPNGGTVDGERGDHILLAPPFILEEDHVEEIARKLSQVIDSTTRSL